jgi:1,5-anhydro-D-fructose reductase (1,5-anhydro-D-mannitol-forming)
MLKIGIIGLGFMGKMHFRCWKSLPDVQLTAICDIDPQKFASTAGAAGNIAGAEQPLDFSGVSFFTDAREMFRQVQLDAVSITLPTYLHAEYTTLALQSGVNVLCEKPMALTIADCQGMIAAAEKTGKLLQIGHCIRFWPQYATAKQIIDSGEYGAVRAATFQRLSATPTWAWNGWLMDGQRSGGAILDMHIHDSDYVQYLFGLPPAVFTRAARGPSGDLDHSLTSYLYPDGKVVTAEGGWMMAPGFGFEMSFNIVLDKATLVFNSNLSPSLKLSPQSGGELFPVCEDGDGYIHEIRHFAALLAGQDRPAILTPNQSLDSVRLVQAERASALTGAIVSL